MEFKKIYIEENYYLFDFLLYKKKNYVWSLYNLELLNDKEKQGPQGPHKL